MRRLTLNDRNDYRLLAFYKVARDYNYTKPNVTKSKIIDVVEGRHPLMECATTFVLPQSEMSSHRIRAEKRQQHGQIDFLKQYIELQVLLNDSRFGFALVIRRQTLE